MARSLTASGDNLRKASPTVGPPATGTIAIKVKPNWSSGDGVAHTLYMFQNAGLDFLHLVKFSNNNIYAGWLVGGNDYRVVIADTGLFTAGTACSVWLSWDDVANSTLLHINSALVGSTATLVTATLDADFTLGNRSSGITQENCDAALAEFGMWNAVLSFDDNLAFTAGYSPRHIARGNLIKYHPLEGRTSPEPCLRTSEGLTVTGTAFADHPRVIRGVPPQMSALRPATMTHRRRGGQFNRLFG